MVGNGRRENRLKNFRDAWERQPASEKLGAGCFLGFQVALTGGVYAELRYFHGAREGDAVTALPFDFSVAGVFENA